MFLWFGAANAQNFAFGPRVGISQTQLSLKSGNFIPGDAEVGYHVGIFARIGGGGIYVQPEVLYAQTSGTFTFSGPTPGGGSEFKADFNRLDIPIMVGFKLFKILRIQAGPIASIDIDSKLRDAIETVEEVEYKSSTLGYQAGVGLDIGNLYLDAKYESSLSAITENIGTFQTDQRVSQFVFSLGFKLF